VGGYYLYYWQSNGDTPKRVDVGKRTTYTLEGLEVGQPYTFAVTAHDAQGGRESVWSNQVHRQIETSSFTVEAPGVLANDHTQDGNALTAELVSGANHGTVDLRQDGSFIYTPHNGFHGNDSFTYRAIRGAMASVPATVTLHVTSINGEPRAAVSFIHTTAVSSQR
jgi:hypothetical protein